MGKIRSEASILSKVQKNRVIRNYFILPFFSVKKRKAALSLSLIFRVVFRKAILWLTQFWWAQMLPAAGFADFCSMPVTAISSKFPNHAFFHAKMYCIYRAKAHYRLFSIFLHFSASILCFITIFYQYLWCCSHICLVYTDDTLFCKDHKSRQYIF